MKTLSVGATLGLCLFGGAMAVQGQGTTGKHVSISTRAAGEFYAATANTQGVAPGDVAMQMLLQDNGISARILPDKLFYDAFGESWLNKDDNVEHPVDMAILSGSSGSSDVPDVAPLLEQGTAIMMGEHVCLAEEERLGSIKMYGGTGTGHGELRNNQIREIKIVDKTHPITSGIQTDAEGFVQVFREPSAAEGFFTGWLNTDPAQIIPSEGLYENRLALGNKADAAEGTVILAEIPVEFAPSGNADMVVCLAVLDKGAKRADGSTSNSRLVHWMSNEEGSGGPHRNFLALNKTGRELFVRAAKWALELDATSAVNDFSLYGE